MRAALIALAASAFSTTFAFADPRALDLVQSVCVSHSADTVAATAELATRGWRQITDEERRQRDPSDVAAGFIMNWSRSQAWAPEDDPSLAIVLGEGPVGNGEARAEYCAIVERIAFSRQVRAVRRWLGFNRFQTWGPGGDIFAYLRDAEGALGNGADVAPTQLSVAMEQGRYGFVQVVGDNATSVVNFSVLHPAQR
ncbi:MAG: hypothetical protein R3C31_12120 [Hyphomonadaceae bacterium]